MITRSLRYSTSIVFAYLIFFTVICSGHVFADQQDLLIEAEAFEEYGGWGIDTQFIRNMGSPYLIAHGLGKPVKDAKTQIKLPKAGRIECMFGQRIGSLGGMLQDSQVVFKWS